ncbi:hypothetical protein PR202_ga30641 [Eleusine coracana subsp. coracana]|uniref:Uncharacterized protein n=1 Tax=Eleusine coracana subsp. coracana TaxID=191504 RepID=A0AAV5DNX1_ELECO|nr:hypothetical protein PR202_ga30641 [Eleusine coracana subsp. coracana]
MEARDDAAELGSDPEERPCPPALLRDLKYIILQELRAQGYKEAAHSLERETRLYLDAEHVTDLVRRGAWDEAERYIGAFAGGMAEDPYSARIFFVFRRRKDIEALERRFTSEEGELLVNDLKAVAPYDEEVAKLVAAFDNFSVSPGSCAVEIKKLIEANPLFQDKLEFPSFEDSRLSMLINQSFSYQHSLCKKKKNPEVGTLFSDHSCDSEIILCMEPEQITMSDLKPKEIVKPVGIVPPATCPRFTTQCCTTNATPSSPHGVVAKAVPSLVQPPNKALLKHPTIPTGAPVIGYGMKRICVGHPDKVVSLLYINDGMSLLALGSNAIHKLWNYKDDAKNHREVRIENVMHLANGFVMKNDTSHGNAEEATACMALSKNESCVLPASGGKVSVFNTTTFKIIVTFMEPPPAVTFIVFHPQCKFIALGMEDSTIQIFDVRIRQVTNKLQGHHKKITGLSFSQLKNVLVSSGADAEWPPGNELRSRISSAVFSCDGLLVYAAFCDGTIKIFRGDLNKLFCDIDLSDRSLGPLSSVRSVYPMVIAADPLEPDQIALGMSDGDVIVQGFVKCDGVPNGDISVLKSEQGTADKAEAREAHEAARDGASGGGGVRGDRRWRGRRPGQEKAAAATEEVAEAGGGRDGGGRRRQATATGEPKVCDVVVGDSSCDSSHSSGETESGGSPQFQSSSAGLRKLLLVRRCRGQKPGVPCGATQRHINIRDSESPARPSGVEGSPRFARPPEGSRRDGSDHEAWMWLTYPRRMTQPLTPSYHLQAPTPAAMAARPWWLEDLGHMLDFVIVGDKMLESVGETLSYPIVAATTIVGEALRATRLEPARPQVVSQPVPPTNYGDQLWSCLERYLGPAPDQDDLQQFAFALANVHGQLLGGEPLRPNRLAQALPDSYPRGLRNAAGCLQDMSIHRVVPACAGTGFVDVIERLDESLFDLLDMGSLEDFGSDSGSCTGSYDLPREGLMVQLAPTPATGGAGTSAAGAIANPGTPALANPVTVAGVGDMLVDIPVAAAGEPRPVPCLEDPQQRLRARRAELEETRRQLEHEKE